MVFAYTSPFASKSGFEGEGESGFEGEGESGFEGEYDVFLTFIGADVQAEFTVVLYNSLIDAGINVFRDDVEFDVDEGMDRLVQQSINNSKIYVPIFSRNYASSQWCLRELSQIVANTLKSEGNKEILPIFFDVAPDDVKLKTPLYCDAILDLKRKKKLSNKEVDAWRGALMEVDATKGWEIKYYKGHDELMKLIVEEVMQKLQTEHRSVTKHLVGIDDRITAISKLLDISSDGVRLIKIHGMGGIGKTTLTKAVFNQLSSHFGKSCFLEDVRAKSSRIDGLVKLQKELLAKIGHHVGTRNIDEIDYGMKRTRKALSNEKVLVVLDDVDSSEQVDKLVGESTLRSGSRILITTRDKAVLGISRPKYQILDYEMEMMSIDHALELFSWHAFNRDSPSDDYNDISREIISTTGRLPLALEVIGSFLYRKPQELWKETLGELRKAPHKDVFVRLRISYNALTVEQQQIFLDIACFLIGEDKMNAIYMWRDCQLFPDSGVDVLVRMSLVKIVENNTFWMHDQLRDLGREIVRLENPMNPKERSRIWTCREVLDAIRAKEMNRNVQALSLDSNAQNFDDKVLLSKENGRFEHLRFLKLLGGTLAGDLTNCLPNLRWFSWYLPPQICEWNNLYLKNIVVLEFTGVDSLDDSRLRDLIKRARKLKVLSLKSCHNIIKTPDFSGCPNLERLAFEDCFNLRRIDGSIGKLEYLIDLKIDMCFCLEDLPKEIGNLVYLKYFFVQRCKVKKLPDSIWKLKSLRVLHFSSRFFALASEDLWELPSAIGMLRNLEVLLVNSLNLRGQLPSRIGSLHFLRYLNLSYTRLSEIPETIGMLCSLKRLELMACHNIQELPTLPTSLTHLRVSSASLQVVPNLSNLTNLVELDLIIEEKEEINSVSMSYSGLRGYPN